MDRPKSDLKFLFLAALDRDPGPERHAYLDEACGGDAKLRLRVEALLAAHDRADEVLGAGSTPATEGSVTFAESLRPAEGGPTVESTLAGALQTRSPAATVDVAPALTIDGNPPRPPRGNNLPTGTAVRYFGDYEVCKELGRGGMGVVYEARQVSLNRPVALKMIKAGVLADEAELRRFQNEAEAVALLDHAGIVPVYEVGDHDGQRYFSMKLVKGGNLGDQLISFKNDPRGAATLLAEVAEAVHHAHMRGILHRDLKPANILLDADGHPHVTDFGLAKKIEDPAEMTLSGAVLGTPSYMSPEQSLGRRGSITTATDVYGLGSVLYALLASRAPFAGDSLMDTLAMVRETLPEPPHKFNPGVPRDLETICLKCLEKDPRRRYSSAQAIADDLRRWLDNRPISARPVGSIERLGLWARRRPAVAALTACVALASIGGIGAVIIVQDRANYRLSLKNNELAAEKALVEVERARVQQRFELAQDAIRTFHSGVSEDVLLKEPNLEGLRTRLLNSASEFYGRLETLLRGQSDRPSKVALGKAYEELGKLTDEIGAKAKAREIREKAVGVGRELAKGKGPGDHASLDLARALDVLGWQNWELHNYEDFMRQCTEAAALAEGVLKAADPKLALEADHERAFAHMKLASEISKYDPDEGLSHNAKAIESLERILKAVPDDRKTQGKLARMLMENGGIYSIELLQPVEGGDYFDRSVVLFERLAQADPDSVPSQVDLSYGYGSRGFYQHMRTGRHDAASADLERAKAIRRKLVAAYPTNTYYRFHLGWAEMYIAEILASAGRSAEALAEYESAMEHMRPMAARNPSVFKIINPTRICLIARGELLASLGRWDEAVWSFAEGFAVSYSNPAPIYEREAAGFEAEATRSPERFKVLGRVVAPAYYLAIARMKHGRISEAMLAIRRNVAIREEIAAGKPGDRESLIDVARTNFKSAVVIAEHWSAQASLAYFDRAVDVYGQLAASQPDDLFPRKMLALAYRNRAVALARLGRVEPGRRDAESGLAVRRSLLAGHPGREAYRLDLATDLAGLSRIDRQAGRKADAIAAASEAVELFRPLIETWPHAREVLNQAGDALLALAEARLDEGRVAEASSLASRAAELLDRMIPEFSEEYLPRARAHALLATLIERESGPASAGRLAIRDEHLALAIRALRSAIALGFRSVEILERESDLDPLRTLAEFQALCLDLNFPADPFAR